MTREELRDYVETQRSLNNIPYHVYTTLIDEIDTLEHDLRKGHWVFVHPLQENDGGAYMCSNCETGDWSYQSDYNFCPNCGAKMAESEE